LDQPHRLALELDQPVAVAVAQAEGARAPAGSFDVLTPRQREVLPLIAEASQPRRSPAASI